MEPSLLARLVEHLDRAHEALRGAYSVSLTAKAVAMAPTAAGVDGGGDAPLRGPESLGGRAAIELSVLGADIEALAKRARRLRQEFIEAAEAEAAGAGGGRKAGADEEAHVSRRKAARVKRANERVLTRLALAKGMPPLRDDERMDILTANRTPAESHRLAQKYKMSHRIVLAMWAGKL